MQEVGRCRRWEHAGGGNVQGEVGTDRLWWEQTGCGGGNRQVVVGTDRLWWERRVGGGGNGQVVVGTDRGVEVCRL